MKESDNPGKVTFIQTADPVVYKSMLDLTSQTVRAYCDRWGHRYEQFVGIKRGCYPWHATYNRMFMLWEMVERQHEGWVFYMDADALISDQDFGLNSYLADKHHLAGIFGGWCDLERPHCVNAGGFAVNLGHPMATRLINDWWWCGHTITDQQFADAVSWDTTIANDQDFLCCILDRYYKQETGLKDFLFEEAHVKCTVNHGHFIKQRLRCKYGSLEERMIAIEDEVRTVLPLALAA